MERPRIVEDLLRSLSSRDPVHGWDHVSRVRALARRIALELGGGVDLEALDLAVLMHDLGRYVQGPEHHAEVSADLAGKMLRALGYEEDKVNRVCGAIRDHSYSLGREPDSVEGKILSDADKIDAIGAVGVARAFTLGGAWGRSLENTLKHLEEKLLKLHERLYLDISKKLARERVEFLKNFCTQILKELCEDRGEDLGPSEPCSPTSPHYS